MTIKERVGIFGGTFDPPHIGHQILGMEAYDELQLDQLFWVLAPEPPHKLGKRITPLDIRIEMVQAAIDEDRIFKFSSVDIDRLGPHYVVDTMRTFRALFPAAELSFIMGGDSLHDLATWHAPREFVNECDRLGVMHRPGERIDLKKIEMEIPGISEKIHFIEAPLLEISSNLIRKLVSERKPFRYYLPEAVYEIVLRNGLYEEIEENLHEYNAQEKRR
jgi:nicotinate-nucleotide adenylyltransferase